MLEVDDPDVMDAVGLMARGYARRIGLRAGVDADDLRQEGMLAIARYRPDNAALAMVMAKRAMQRQVSAGIAWDAGLATAKLSASRPCREAIPDIDRLGLRLALDALPAKHGTALRLRYLDGLTEPETAEAMRACRKSVTVWSRLGLASLRESLDDSHAEEYGRSVPLRNPAAYKAHARRMHSESDDEGEVRARRLKRYADRSARRRAAGLPRYDQVASRLAVIAAAEAM